MDAIAAAVIGGTLLTGGVGTVVGSLFGSLIKGIIETIITFQGTLSSVDKNRDRITSLLLRNLTECI